MDEAEDQLAELVGFLQDPKPEVRRFAAEGVLAQTESQDFLNFCQRQPRKVARSLLRLAEQAEAAADAAGTDAGAGGGSAQKRKQLEAAELDAAGSAALQALVNLSAVPAVREEMLDLGAARRCSEAMRAAWLEGRANNAHWHSMLLANLTTTKAAQEALLADPSLLRFLLAAYVTRPRPPGEEGYDDPAQFLGKVLGNICVLPEGRRFMAGGDEGAVGLVSLLMELNDRGRRLDVLGVLSNVCLDVACHEAVARADPLGRMMAFLYPWEKVDAASRDKLPEKLRQQLEAVSAALTGDEAVRSAAAGCLMGLIRSPEGRNYLRVGGSCSELVRAWSMEETMASTREILETVQPAFILSEEELEVERERIAKQAQAECAGLSGLLDDVDGS